MTRLAIAWKRAGALDGGAELQAAKQDAHAIAAKTRRSLLIGTRLCGWPTATGSDGWIALEAMTTTTRRSGARAQGVDAVLDLNQPDVKIALDEEILPVSGRQVRHANALKCRPDHLVFDSRFLSG
jgi:hypothetical protein